MQSASGATYLSKTYLKAYQHKKSKNQMKKQQSIQPEKLLEKEKNQEMKDEQQNLFQGQVNELQEIKELKSDSDELDQEQYDIENRSCEAIDSDDLDGGLNLSENEDQGYVFQSKQNVLRQKAQWKQEPARKFRQEIDTNVFKIGFSTLKDKAELATGDPISCEKCKAYFNIHSIVSVEKSLDGEEKQSWKCEFCLFVNPVSIEDEEKPQSKAVNYILEASAQIQDKKVDGKKDISVVFCIDQSGSMCCSQPIQGKHQLKGDKVNEMKELMKFGDGSDQYMQGERNVTYVSRMQCLQAAIDQQISDMQNGAHDRKLGIVSFNDQVSIYGDGQKEPQIISGDYLNNYEYLLKNGKDQGIERMKLKVQESAKVLQKKLMSLEETGPTALGPAVTTAIAMASQGAPGSIVVVCTDGLANVGVGSFDEAKVEADFQKIDQFYEMVGQFAKTHGVTVNIVSITGDECNLDSLSKVAAMTGGDVERVDPVDLTKNFSNILSQPVIASNVIAKVKLHKGLQFRNENPINLSEDLSLLTREVGNVTSDTEITFEYTLKKVSELAKMEDIDLTTIQFFPFQSQITYTALDGSKCIRVMTELQNVSSNRDELEKNANFEILGKNAIQQSANIAKAGNHRFAQAYAKNWNRKMRKVTDNQDQERQRKGFLSNFNSLYDNLGQQDQMEYQQFNQCSNNLNYNQSQNQENYSFGASNLKAQKPQQKLGSFFPKNKIEQKRKSKAKKNIDDGHVSDSESESEEVKKEESQPKKGFLNSIFGGFGKQKAKADNKNIQNKPALFNDSREDEEMEEQCCMNIDQNEDRFQEQIQIQPQQMQQNRPQNISAPVQSMSNPYANQQQNQQRSRLNDALSMQIHKAQKFSKF